MTCLAVLIPQLRAQAIVLPAAQGLIPVRQLGCTVRPDVTARPDVGGGLGLAPRYPPRPVQRRLDLLARPPDLATNDQQHPLAVPAREVHPPAAPARDPAVTAVPIDTAIPTDIAAAADTAAADITEAAAAGAIVGGTVCGGGRSSSSASYSY